MRKFLFLSLMIRQICFAAAGSFFSVSSSGAPADLSVTICLNGKGPLSCQTYQVSGMDLSVLCTIPSHQYPIAGIKINTPGYSVAGLGAPLGNGYYLFGVNNNSPIAISVAIDTTNPPWYPSIESFEHYNSGRSHVFANATFGGSYTGNNTVVELESSTLYPSGYNMSYLDASHAYIYGGGYGDEEGSIGAFVSQVDPSTLAAAWNTQLINTADNGEWDYPGSMGILDDGYIYVIYGYRLAKINPTNGAVVATLVLPTGEGLPENTAYNGFNATSDGTLVMKSLYRQEGCLYQGPSALLNCPDPSDVPPSVLVSVNPTTMQIIDTITLQNPVAARPTITQYQGKEYVYLVEATTLIRYIVNAGVFTLDTTWSPPTLTLEGQTTPTSFVVLNNFLVGQVNTLPSAVALSVIAVSQADASTWFSIQPFLGDPIPELVAQAFAYATPEGGQAISWAPASVSADASSNLIYVSDSLPGKIAAILLQSDGLQVVWTANQVTTEFTTLIGSAQERVLVGTDIPPTQIPGANENDFAVWRNAATGEELARSTLLPAMTQGTMIQPYYSGEMFYEGELGTLIKLTPTANE